MRLSRTRLLPEVTRIMPHVRSKGEWIRGVGRRKWAVSCSKPVHPIRRLFWRRRLRQANQMRRTWRWNPLRAGCAAFRSSHSGRAVLANQRCCSASGVCIRRHASWWIAVSLAIPAEPRHHPPPETNLADPVGPLMFRRTLFLSCQQNQSIDNIEGASASRKLACEALGKQNRAPLSRRDRHRRTREH